MQTSYEDYFGSFRNFTIRVDVLVSDFCPSFLDKEEEEHKDRKEGNYFSFLRNVNDTRGCQLKYNEV